MPVYRCARQSQVDIKLVVVYTTDYVYEESVLKNMFCKTDI
jgi:hypothetical protein